MVARPSYFTEDGAGPSTIHPHMVGRRHTPWLNGERPFSRPEAWPVFGGDAAHLLGGVASESALESIMVGEPRASCPPCWPSGLRPAGARARRSRPRLWRRWRSLARRRAWARPRRSP